MFAGLSSGGEIRAFAKINLHLRVLNKRDDGYHYIVSLMSAIGLNDLLKLEQIDNDVEGGPTVDIIPRGGSYESVITSTPPGENIIHKAVMRYCGEAGIQSRIIFGIEKNIPAGAGMGGGSADAAAALRLLNDRYGRFTAAQLAEIGKGIGADVPFCLIGGTALCEGIGERITPLKGRLMYPVVIANNGVHVNTAAAYRLLRRGPEIPYTPEMLAEEKRKLADAVEQGNLEYVAYLLANDFEEPVFRDFPAICSIKKAMFETGAFHAAMTGSGSTVIGLFKNTAQAEDAAACLRKTIKLVIVTSFI